MKTFKINQLKINPSNPRIIKDEKFNRLCKSIQDFPEMMPLRPIIYDENKIILGGNMRFKALQHLGMNEVPADWVKSANELNEEQKKEFVIKDNNSFGEYDYDLLANEWDDLPLEEWGIDLPEIDIEQEAKEDDYVMPEKIETDIVLGDIIEIGQHRLMCGDSTDSDAVAKLTNEEMAEVLFTSPPYSDMREYNGGKDLSLANLINFIPAFMPFTNYQIINLGIQRKNNEINPYWDKYIEMAKGCGYKFLSWNVWMKPNASSIGQQTAMFPINIEWIFVFGNERKDLNRTIETITGGQKRANYIRHSDGTKESKGFHVRNTHTFLPAAIQVTQENKPSGDHPATFPIELAAKYIQSMTNEDEIIADAFLGSGTTMVAAHQLNRKCYGMEIDPQYCQVIVDRMKQLDASLEVKINGKVIS